MIVLDTNALVFLYRPNHDQEQLHDRMAHLFDTAKNSSQVLGIPAPVLAEFLIGEPTAEGRQNFLNLFNRKNRVFKLLPFDLKSATVCAVVSGHLSSNPNELGKTERQKIKIDRQILAIALSNQASQIISHDKQLLSAAAAFGNIRAIDIQDLPLPEPPQPQLF